MDYLDHQRYIPKTKALSKAEIDDIIEKKVCKSCKHYDFYYCRGSGTNTAPESECKSVELYCPNEFYKSHIKNEESEEPASV